MHPAGVVTNTPSGFVSSPVKNHMKIKQRYPQPQLTSPIELAVIISNGNPLYDTKLRFEFTREDAEAQVWLARLPRLKNYDAFPRQISENRWELQLDAEGETHPMEIHAYPPENAGQWLKRIFHYENKRHTELLILAHHDQFTITLTEHL